MSEIRGTVPRLHHHQQCHHFVKEESRNEEEDDYHHPLFFITLNNQGVELLQQGLFLEALAKFRQELDEFRLQSNIVDEEDDDDDDVVSGGSFIRSVSINVLKEESKSRTDDVQESNNYTVALSAASPHNVFCIYFRAFVMMQPPAMGCTCSSRLSSLLSSNKNVIDYTVTLLLNMGIACQLRGLSNGIRSTYFLQKSYGLYKMVVAFLENTRAKQQHGNEQQASETVVVLNKTLLLALWSNMGYVASHFFLMNEVNYCQMKLATLVRDLHPPGTTWAVYTRHGEDANDDGISATTTDDFPSTMCEDEYMIFVLIALLVPSMATFSSAPAA